MKVSISRDVLKAAVSTAAKIAQRAGTADLACVLLDAKEGLTIEATDLTESARFNLEALVEEPGQALISAKMLSGVVGKLPDASVTIDADPRCAVVSCGSAVYQVAARDPRDFPRFSAVEGGGSFRLSAEVLGALAKHAAAFAARDDSKPELQGVLAEAADGKLTLSATDNFHGIVYDVAAETDGEVRAILPAGFLTEAKGAGDATVRVSGGKAILEREGMAMVTRLVEGQFPQLSRFLPTEYESRTAFDADDLSAALDRSTFAGEAVDVSCSEESAIVECHGKDAGSFREVVPCETKQGYGVFRCSPVFLRHAVMAVGGERVEVMTSGGLKPITVEGSLGRAIVMPMRKHN